ncbi:hypothetical protein [Pseudoxanthomonas sp.]|jgi:hypothetical protein|uniref:hypothetical protein n=1 Tax=Pseudoxanthomonas sp. TaxID=1871049 RepID=UPI002E137023|nr:hypothetical protein [Pseudoxanthomonas sp.]
MTPRIQRPVFRYAGICFGMLAACGCLAAHPDAEQARRIADQFVAGQQAAAGNPQESREAGEVVATDLDGDGQAEIVVLWTMYGPTYWDHGVAVLAKRGSRYVPAGETQDALGLVEGMTVAGGVIELKTKWPGPHDPRCCPTVPKTLRYRWTAGALSPLK